MADGADDEAEVAGSRVAATVEHAVEEHGLTRTLTDRHGRTGKNAVVDREGGAGC